MADIKWIKITTDIFDDDKIKIIDRYPARDEILVIWFKLLALAGKVNQSGLLFMSNRIAYTPEMLAAIFSREEKTVEMALGVFQKYGMIHVEDNQIIAISNWEKHQNADGMERVREQTRLRVARYKEKQQLIASNVTANVTLTQGNATEIEQELEIELDKEKIKDDHLQSDCELVWAAYPEKLGKAEAMKKIPKLIKQHGKDALIVAVERYVSHVQHQRRNGFKDLKYMHGRTFFNGRYLDFMTSNESEKKEGESSGLEIL